MQISGLRPAYARRVIGACVELRRRHFDDPTARILQDDKAPDSFRWVWISRRSNVVSIKTIRWNSAQSKQR
ncbi:hypothetical protein [Nocardia brasiliensis]|uniref:hypothetical protein n=1 Tax=Nocardia brasiliensis TaxID=37326 RepID=UPI0024577615|nr:hypothetical protein [Nocardia brasiliensis]